MDWILHVLPQHLVLNSLATETYHIAIIHLLQQVNAAASMDFSTSVLIITSVIAFMLVILSIAHNTLY